MAKAKKMKTGGGRWITIRGKRIFVLGRKKGKRKTNITTAARKLAKLGYQLGDPVPWKPGDKGIKYNVTRRGKTRRLTARTILRLIGKVD